jgi:protein-disulfide isomerase
LLKQAYNYASFFSKVSITIGRMPNLNIKPVLVIIAAVVAAGGIAVYLSRGDSSASEPASSSTSGSTGGGRVRGNPEAPVTIVEYGDFQCPTCGRYHPILDELLRRYAGKLKLEFHHFPLISIHPNAMGAALAAEAAGDQGKFWEMHDMLFEHQAEWSPNPNAEALFLQYALQLGLDSNQFMQSMRSPATRDRVLADVTQGNPIVTGTPTFIINGQVLPDLLPLEGLAEKIDTHLASAGK